MQKQIRVLSIFGTRPEAVKMAPVIQRLTSDPLIQSLTCVTAQHREMLDQVLNLFSIKPDFDLNLMRPNQSLAEITAAIFTNLDPIIKKTNPDWIIAQGDTTTVMASSLLSYYNRVKFGHVEAGLRTGDKFQPFPEEINRRIAGVTADLHFAPTEWSRQNLLKENVPSEQILVTGNPVIDALQQVVSQNEPDEVKALLKKIGSSRILLVTAHRRENFGEPLENICHAITKLVEFYGNSIHIVFPVHLNPNVQKTVHSMLDKYSQFITLLPPLDYLPMIHIMKNAFLVLTDSGGLQEEAPGLGKPVLVMRETTERPEGVDAGTVKLVGTDIQKIFNAASLLLNDPAEYEKMAKSINPYGDGKAAENIVKGIIDYSGL